MNYPFSQWRIYAWLAVGVVALCGAGAMSAASGEPEWRVGLASIKITPEQPLMLAGYAARTRALSEYHGFRETVVGG